MSAKIFIYGAGVIGSVYAVRFSRAGFDVTVLARGDRLNAIRSGGLRTRHVFLGEEERADVRCVDSLDQAWEYDLALVTVRAPQIMGALADLTRSPNPAPVVVIGNNFQGHAEQAACVGGGRFVLGFGSFGGYREDGVIVYLDGRTPKRPEAERRRATTLGVTSPEAEPALSYAIDCFRAAGLPTARNADMVAWLKCHAALVFPLAGAIYAAGGGQECTCRTRDALVLGVRACHELFRALRKLGVGTEPRSLKLFLGMPEPLIIRMLERGLAGGSAAVAVFGHANAVGGRREIAEQALALDAFVRAAGLPLESWDRLLPYFAPGNTVPPIADGSRALRLRVW
jgi:2-dehydropantoate 2-reductase